MRPHEEQIVRAVSDSVRVLAIQQIALTWWTDSRWGRSRAKAAMASLAKEGWLRMQRVLSRPIISAVGPMLDWNCGDVVPDFAALTRTLHHRSMCDAKLITVVFATRRAVAMFGNGRAPAVKLTQMTHDLNVSEVFLHYRRSGLPTGRWVAEDRLADNWPIRQRPDAVLRDETGNIVRAVEYGGDYPPSRLAELHDGLSSIGLSYEVW